VTEPDDTATQVTRTAEAVGASKYLSRGTSIGRYVVLDQLGEGGMGVVYRAFDPELDRMVALKLLHVKSATGASIGDSSWLLREAQALARLSHPNVVIVHDVGVLPDNQVFIAMELVDGITLRDWLAAAHRTWREVRDVMLAAGTGLAAAHAAKLVHRDFKPENVIVGKDGRVRVMDFGLARHKHGDSEPPRDSDLEIEIRSPLRADLTVVEGVIGTPAYMAPEIFEGVDADARSDQFSFGVVMFEALAGVRPFAKVELIPTVASPKPELPASAKVPARIAAVALRAIAVDPAERFETMKDLLAALAVDPTARRRRIALAIGALAAIGIAIGATTLVARSEPQVCKGIDKRLAGVWDATRKHDIRAGYDATKVPFAAKSYAALEPALDLYANDWVTMSVESCEATRVRRDQTEEALSLRQSCLDRRLDELAALTKLLVEPNRQVVEKAAAIVLELEPLARCADVAALREPGAPPAELAPKLAEVDKKLAEAKAQVITTRVFPALVVANEAAKLARETAYPPAIAEVEGIRGAVLLATGNDDEAATALIDSTWAAEVSHRDDLVARGAIALAHLTALAKPNESRIWLGLGVAGLKRAGIEKRYESERYKAEALLFVEAGNLPAAVAAGERSFAARENFYGRGSPILFGHEIFLAGILTRAFDYARAASHYEHAIELRKQTVGDSHADIALALSNLAVCYHHMGAFDKARETFDRALALREKLFGADSPILMPTLDNYGVFLAQTGDLKGALAMLDRALKLGELAPGRDHPDYQVVATDRADVLVKQSKLAEARAVFDDLLPREQASHSTTLATTQSSRAELALAAHAWAEAATFADQAIAGFEAAGGQDNPELWRPLTALGRAKLELAKPADARAALERAIAIGTRIHLTPAELQPARDALGRVAP
jgi:tetratricopeptide (TPR) repeat protein